MWTAGAAGLLEEPSQFFLAVRCQNGLVTSHHHITEEESAFRVVLIQELQELQELQALAFESDGPRFTKHIQPLYQVIHDRATTKPPIPRRPKTHTFFVLQTP